METPKVVRRVEVICTALALTVAISSIILQNASATSPAPSLDTFEHERSLMEYAIAL